MAEKVACIVRGESHRYSDYRCITQIRTDTGTTYTREQAHDSVRLSPGSIYVEARGSRSNLIPVMRDGVRYVRTTANDTMADNLLAVSDC